MRILREDSWTRVGRILLGFMLAAAMGLFVVRAARPAEIVHSIDKPDAAVSRPQL